MRLLLLRHGTAEPRGEDGGDWPERRLTAKGIKQCQSLGAWMARTKLRFDCVLCSPYRRALETARRTLEALGQPIEPIVDARLAPQALPQDAANLIADLGGGVSSVLVVGHEPLLSRLAALLIGDADVRIDLRKAGLIEIALEGPRPLRGQLLGLLRPRYLTSRR